MRKIIFSLILLTLAQFATNAYGLSCSCGSAPCDTPTCCKSGALEKDACGCCQVCAKGKGEKCGGMWGTRGNCAFGLSCLKKCSKRDEDGCDDLSHADGVCVENSKRKNPPEGRHEFTDPPENLESIITCDDFERENNGRSCFCTKKPSGLNLLGENCSTESSGTGGPPVFKGWCFLENVKSAKNPSKDCFEDAWYSERWGRFYSNEACAKEEDCGEYREEYQKYPDEDFKVPYQEDGASGRDGYKDFWDWDTKSISGKDIPLDKYDNKKGYELN